MPPVVPSHHFVIITIMLLRHFWIKEFSISFYTFLLASMASEDVCESMSVYVWVISYVIFGVNQQPVYIHQRSKGPSNTILSLICGLSRLVFYILGQHLLKMLFHCHITKGVSLVNYCLKSVEINLTIEKTLGIHYIIFSRLSSLILPRPIFIMGLDPDSLIPRPIFIAETI